MNKLLLVAGLVTLALSSCAATLQIKFVVPTQNNDADCGQPPILTVGTDSLRCVIRAGSIADSMMAARGAIVLRSYQVPSGNYQVEGITARIVNGQPIYGCPITAMIEAPARPHRGSFAP